MNTDHCFRIGATHEVCQDYAVSGVFQKSVEKGGVEEIAYAIVSDGCSGADYTDIGSRCLTHSARSLLFMAPSLVFSLDAETLGKLIIDKAANATDRIGLTRECLEATLMLAVVQGTQARVLVYGDGGIVRQSHGCREVQHFNYCKSEPGAIANAPFYLSYRLSKSRTESYFKHFSQFRRTTISDSSGSKTIDEGAGVVTDLRFDVIDTDQIILMTDGVDQFYDGKSENVHWSVQMDVLTMFKSTHGQFINRRVQSHERICRDNQVTHHDDLSLAGIVV